MLEPPDLPIETLAAALRDDYGIQAAQIAFLPLGADPHTAIFRAEAGDGRAYFVKVRSGAFDDITVTVPHALGAQGIEHLVAPIATRSGEAYIRLGAFTLIVYPFVEGENAYAREFTAQHWHSFGATLRRIHTAHLPPALVARIPVECYLSTARDRLAALLEELDTLAPPDEVAAALLAFLRPRRAAVHDLVARAERHAQALRASPPALVLCHGDLHAGNLHITPSGDLYITDWDTLIRAPKEHDLMFVGGGLGFRGHTPAEEAHFFYAGYGPAHIDTRALAYYRYDRIVQDLAIYCSDVLRSDTGGADRDRALIYTQSNFAPGGTIERAYAAENAPAPTH